MKVPELGDLKANENEIKVEKVKEDFDETDQILL